MNTQQPLNADVKKTEKPGRKAYAKPMLKEYGDLTDLTRSNATSGKDDGSGHSNKHFTA